MTTQAAALTYRQPAPRLNLWPWLLLAAVGVSLVLCAHALRHSNAEAIALQCQTLGPQITLRNPSTNHTADLCLMGPDAWGRVIRDKRGNILTCFGGECLSKNSLAKSLANLMRSGYTKIEYIAPEVKAWVESVLVGLP